MQDKNIISQDNNKNINDIEKISKIIESIEEARQKAALKQIEITDKDNERQYQFAIKKEDNEFKKWNRSFLMGCIAASILSLAGLYLLIFQNKIDIGLGLLSTTLSGVFGYIAGAGSCNKK